MNYFRTARHTFPIRMSSTIPSRYNCLNPMLLTPGTRLGPYEIIAPVGARAMGEVYRTRDTRLGRDVALKILPEEVAGDASRRARFEQAARAVAALNHPNIFAVYDVGDGNMVCELVDGERPGGAEVGLLRFDDLTTVCQAPSISTSPTRSDALSGRCRVELLL